MHCSVKSFTSLIRKINKLVIKCESREGRMSITSKKDPQQIIYTPVKSDYSCNVSPSDHLVGGTSSWWKDNTITAS